MVLKLRSYDLIVNKRNRKEHSYGEIEYLVNSYTRGETPDYQISAWLMAAFLNGLNEEETFYLTKAMLFTYPALCSTNYQCFSDEGH